MSLKKIFSNFGQTMENAKHRVNIHATTSDNNTIKWLNKMTVQNNRYNKGFQLVET